MAKRSLRDQVTYPIPPIPVIETAILPSVWQLCRISFKLFNSDSRPVILLCWFKPSPSKNRLSGGLKQFNAIGGGSQVFLTGNRVSPIVLLQEYRENENSRLYINFRANPANVVHQDISDMPQLICQLNEAPNFGFELADCAVVHA